MRPWTTPLRTWQEESLPVIRQTAPDCLVMATPGAGKTTLACKVIHEHLTGGLADRAVVVCHTDHLREQWTRAAGAVGIHLDPSLSADRAVEATDYHGAVVTYQQVALSPAGLAAATARRRTLAVFDEIHHAADGQEWGTGLREAFGLASYRLALSGTPFRSDDQPIPFVRYVEGVSQADYTYGYREAIKDRICRPIYFPSYEGDLTWTYDGTPSTATFADVIEEEDARRRLKTALLTEGWIGPVLQDAHRRLTELRRDWPAGGLVIAMTQEHAKQVGGLLATITQRTIPVAISDDPASSQTIRTFARSRQPWLVAVKMVSEGVDIPRLMVGVYATNVSTEMYFRQVVGRFVRMEAGLAGSQRAWLYLPKDPVLVQYAKAIQAERAHEIDEDRQPDAGDGDARAGLGLMPRKVYRPISGQVVGEPHLFGVDLASEPARSVTAVVVGHEGGPSLYEHKEGLRRIHRALVGEVCRRRSVDHRTVNLELIKRAGGRIETATVEQLDRRIRLLERWRDGGAI